MGAGVGQVCLDYRVLACRSDLYHAGALRQGACHHLSNWLERRKRGE